jgi:hypothetical protein
VKWMPIESSAVTAVSYVPDEHLLYLKFHSGEIYRYFDFPQEQFDEFLTANSKGKYFVYNIRDRFRYEPVGEVRSSERTRSKTKRRKCRHNPR